MYEEDDFIEKWTEHVNNVIGEDIPFGTEITEEQYESLMSFEIPEKLQVESITSIEETESKTGYVKERLGSFKDIFEFFKECTEVEGYIADEETGEKGITFLYNGDRYIYLPECEAPRLLACFSEIRGPGFSVFRNDEIFRAFVRVYLKWLSKK